MRIMRILVGAIICSYLAIIGLSLTFPVFYQWLINTGNYGKVALFISIVILLFLVPIIGFFPDGEENQEKGDVTSG